MLRLFSLQKFKTLLIFLLTISTLSSASATTYYVDQTSGVDPSLAGDLTGPVVWTESGKYGGGLVFDGQISGNPTTYVSLPATTALKPAQFTFSAWIYANSAGTSQAIFKPSYCNGWDSGYAMYLGSNGSVRFRYGTGSAPGTELYTTGTDYRGGWYFVTYTFDGTTISIYVDGVFKTSASAATMGYSGSPSSSWIGGTNGMNSFNGTIDDVRFYNRPLDSSEITDLYNNTNNPTSGLIFYTPFVEGAGTKIRDTKGGDGLSSSYPWKTVSVVNSFLFNPGDSVLFKKGETWREQLTVPSSGSSGSPVTFGAYGSGSNPVIDGSALVTGWSVYSGNIYVADVSSTVSRVFVDDTFYSVAHYPNSGYETITSSANKTSLTSTSFSPPDSTLAGGKIFVRSVPWRMEERTIDTYNSGSKTFTWTGDTSEDIRTGYGFYVGNKLWMLDQAGEWVYDSSQGKLYLWMLDSSDPSAHTISVASTTSKGIYSSNKSDLVFNDITIKNTGADGVEMSSSSRVTIDRLNVSYAGRYGIYAYGSASNNVVIGTTTVSYAQNRGIHMDAVTGLGNIIANNTVSYTGNFGLPSYSYAGIDVNRATGVTVERNTVSNSGYVGIGFSGTSTIIRNNIITGTCIILDDCAAIYTWGNYGNSNQILNNIVTDSIGNYSGTGYSSAQSEGIYLDDYSTGNTVSSNTIVNANKGIYVHNSPNNIITNNNIFKSRSWGFLISEDNLVPNGTIHDNSISGNAIVSLSSSLASASYSGQNGNLDFGTYDSNNYFSTYSGYAVSRYNIDTTTNYNLSGWRVASSQDSLSEDIGLFFSAVFSKVTAYLGSNSITNSTFDSNINNWTNWSADSSQSVTWVSSCGLDGGCLHAVTSHASTLVQSNAFSIQSGTSYEVSFDVISSSPVSGTTYVRLSDNPWTDITSNAFTSTSTRQSVSFTFTAASTITNGVRIDFDTPASDYYVDNVSIRPVTLFTNDKTDDSTIYTNPTTSTSNVDLGGSLYCDLDNSVTPNSFTLAPFASRILLSCFNNNDRVCNNHETSLTASDDCTTSTEEGDYAGVGQTLVIGTNKIDTTGVTRIYKHGKFRNLSDATPAEVADMTITPDGGFTASTSPILDIAISLWDTSTTYQKTWTETSSVSGQATTSHTIGDLRPNTSYTLSIDGNATSTHTSDGSGYITFTYAGGYSTHTFDLSESSIPTLSISLSDSSLTISETSTITFSFSTEPTGFTSADVTVQNGTIGTIDTSSTTLQTVVFTPSTTTEDLTNIITVGTSWTNSLGTAPSSSATSSNYTVDTTRPTSTVSMSDYALTEGETSTVTFTFSEAVTGFTNADITTIANGTMSSVSSADGGITFTAIFTPTTSTTDTTNVIILTMTGLTDTLGNAGTGTVSTENYTVDTTVSIPTLSISLSDSSLTISETSTITFSFSTEPTGFTSADVTVQNGTIGTIDTSSTTLQTVVFTPSTTTEDLTNIITVGTSWTNSLGTAPSSSATSSNYTVDTTRPTSTVSMSDYALTEGETSTVTFTFSEAVTGFTNADITTIANGTMSSVSSADGGITFTSTFTPTTSTTDTTNVIILTMTGLTDTLGNAGTGTVSTENYTVDTTVTVPAAPTVTTGDASSVTQTTVTLWGDITATGTQLVTTRGILYGLTTSYTSTSSETSASYATGTYSLAITNLTCATSYHFQAYALNSVGTSTGSDNTFTTSACDVVVTPTVTSSGGGGGGGWVYQAPTTTVTSTTTPTTITPVTVTNANTTATLIPSVPNTSNISLGIKLSSTGSSVTALQNFLISKGFLPTFTTGKGTFGPKTSLALKNYQKSVGLEPVGYIGKLTKAKIEAELSSLTNTLTATSTIPVVNSTSTLPSVKVASTSSSSVTKTYTGNPACYKFTKDLKLNSQNEDVRQLQRFLNSNPETIIAKTGVGSKGQETDFLGQATVKALKKYQSLHLKELDIATPSGFFFKGTRGLLEKACRFEEWRVI